MNRFYQWLQHRLTMSREEYHVSRGPRIVRTQVTVEEQQRMVLLSMPMDGAVCLCPLCGNPVGALPPDMVGVVTLDHTQCPEPKLGLGSTEKGKTRLPD